MLFSSRVPLPALILWCRALKHGLAAGLSPVRVFRQQATSGPAAARPLAGTLADRMEKGASLEDAVRPFAGRFPALFVELAAVGERAGRLAETFAELEDYFEAVKETRRTFFQLLAWPAFQYFAAIGVITLLLFVLGAIGAGIDPLGIGTGARGALTFLAGAGTFTAAVVGGAYAVAGSPDARAVMEAKALAVPGVAGCFRALALNRFCLAYYLSAEAGMRADRCLRSSLKATANRAYAKEAEWAARSARKGQEVAATLGGLGPRLFPDELMGAVQVGEESGQLAEVMRRQADRYRDEAKRQMKVLANIAGGLVYAAIGVLLIVAIFKIAMAAYVNPLNDAMKAADNPSEWMRQPPR